MKRVIYYLSISAAIIMILPLLVVKGCGVDRKPPGTSKKESPKVIKVFIKDEDRVEEMDFEEYIKGVVAAEMPAEFEMEALKAQAVAARSYAYARLINENSEKSARHRGAAICTDSKCCQAWISKEAAFKKWGIISSYFYWNKIVHAVNETCGQVLTYQGKPISPLYHANSGGKTENAEEVWEGKGKPYLVSVESKGEETGKDYSDHVDIAKKSFIEHLNEKYGSVGIKESDLPGALKIIDYTVGGRVKTVKVGNLTLKGTEFREIFSLKSANFKVEEKDENTLRITTIGYGHGVGMSQRGANCMAKEGSTYEEILKHYYRGVEIELISRLY